METKKSAKADLEGRKLSFFLIGAILALSLTWYAFEYKTFNKKENAFDQQGARDEEEDVVLNTQRDQMELPPPPEPQTTVLEIVENNVDVDFDLTIDAEMNEDDEIDSAPIGGGNDETQDEEEQQIFTFVETQPAYPGGDEARVIFLRENIKYPEIAKESNIQGVVYVGFVIERDGSITNVKVLRGIGGGCDEEAARVVKAMPKWSPGKQREKPVRTNFSIPIKFTLSGS